MAVKLRMTRMGRRHRPFFRVNAVDTRRPRDGRILEKLGHYDPIEKDKDKQVVLNRERVRYWLDKGAIPSDTVSQILLRQGIKHKYAAEKAVRQRRARAAAHAKGRHFTLTEKVAAERAAKKAEEKAKSEAEEKAKAEKKAEAEAQAKVAAGESPEQQAKPTGQTGSETETGTGENQQKEQTESEEKAES